MNQSIKRARALPFSVALFEEESAAGSTESGQAAGESGASVAADDGARRRETAAGRNDRGQFARGETDAQRVYATDLHEANRRIAELNEESATRRRENRDLKKNLDTLQSRQSLVDQRAIRMEAREALRAAGVKRPDLMVDVFLKHAGDSIKIDDQTGDVAGVDAAVPKFKDVAPEFFESVSTGAQNAGGTQGDGSGSGDGSANGAGTGANGRGTSGDADTRGNATGTGASVAGGGTGGDGGFKVANFRDSNVDPKAAMKAYKNSLR